MDYKEVRARNRIKRKGGTTEGREIERPKRIDYKLRRSVAVLCALVVMSIVLGALLLAVNNMGVAG